MSDSMNIVETAEQIEQTGRADIKQRPHGGLDRDDRTETHDPAVEGRVLDLEAPSSAPYAHGGRPLVEPRRPYAMSERVSAAHNKVRDMHRRPAHHDIATPKKLATQWAKVLEAQTAAEAAVRSIPAGIVEAEAERAARLDQASEPVVLPSSSDVRAFLEAEAIKACAAAAEERRRYDVLAEEVADEHLAALAKVVPTEAEAVRAKVADLATAIERLREGVAAIVEVAGSRSKDVMPASMPGKADLSALEAIEQEVAALVTVAEQPTQPRISPTLSQRRAIAAHARQVPSGITPEIIDLARIEEAEAYRHTAHTRGIPKHILENARAAAAYGGAYLR